MKRLHKVSIDRSKMVGTEIISRFTYMDQEIMKNTEKEIEKAFEDSNFLKLKDLFLQRFRFYLDHLSYKERSILNQGLSVKKCESLRMMPVLSWLPGDDIQKDILYLLSMIDYYLLVIQLIQDKKDQYELLVNTNYLWSECAEKSMSFCAANDLDPEIDLKCVKYHGGDPFLSEEASQIVFLQKVEQLYLSVIKIEQLLSEGTILEREWEFSDISSGILDLTSTFFYKEIYNYGYDPMLVKKIYLFAA